MSFIWVAVIVIVCVVFRKVAREWFIDVALAMFCWTTRVRNIRKGQMFYKRNGVYRKYFFFCSLFSMSSKRFQSLTDFVTLREGVYNGWSSIVIWYCFCDA